MNVHLVALYCACLLLGSNGEERSARDGISVHDETIGSESDRGTLGEPFAGLSWPAPGKPSEQVHASTLKDLSKAELATLEKELLPVAYGPSRATDSEGERGPVGDRSNRRSSTVSQSREERNPSGSGHPSDDRVATLFKSVIESLSRGKEGGQQARNLPGLFDPRTLLNLPDFLSKIGSTEHVGLPGLPGLPVQPIRKFIEFLREKLTNKREETNEDRPEDGLFLKRLFQHGKELWENVQENV